MTPAKYRRKLRTHFPGCWRWRRHWQCAVGLVEELSGVLQEVRDRCATVRESGTAEVTISGELYVRIEEVLRRVGEE